MANPQSKDQEIAAKEQELEQLRAQREQGIQEYPKMISSKDNPEHRIIVNSKEEEASHRGQVVPAFDLTPEEQEAKRIAREDADKEAAGAKSRLAGPESEPVKEPAKKGVVSRAVSKVRGKK